MQSPPPDLPRLRIEIKNNAPLELIDLTEALLSIGDEYKRYLRNYPGAGKPSDLRLYVEEIRSGSAIIDVIAWAPVMLPFIEHANSVIQFGKYLKLVYDYLLGESNENPVSDKGSYENHARITEPIAKDNGSQLNIAHVENYNSVQYILNIDSTEANAAQNRIRRDLERLKEPQSDTHFGVMLYWDQARGDLEATAGDRGVIESLSGRPVKITFAHPSLKQQMLHTDDPFGKAFVVDVGVETVEGRPAAYRIIELHDIVDKPGEPE